MRTHIKSTKSGRYRLTGPVPKLGWQDSSSYVFAVEHAESISPEEAREAAENGIVFLPPDDAPEKAWILDFAELRKV